MKRTPLALSLAAALLLVTGCAESVRTAQGGTPSPDKSTLSPSASPATPTPSPSPEVVTRAEACDDLAGGAESIVYRLTTFQVEVEQADGLDDSHYVTAKNLVDDLSDLREVAPVDLHVHIDDLSAYPEVLVDAALAGSTSVEMDPKLAMTSTVETASSCLDKDSDEFAEFRAFYYEAIVGEPYVEE